MIPAKLRRSAGYSLVEVVVAMLISCIIVTAVFGSAMTAVQDSGKNDRRLQYSVAMEQLMAELSNYVTADTAGTFIPGPNTSNGTSGAATWQLEGGGVFDRTSQGGATVNSYALSCGAHYVTGLFPSVAGSPESSPFNGYVLYTVGGGNCPTSPGAVNALSVTMQANWQEP